MDRRVDPELLDRLPAEAPEARASRRDLRRINRLMGHARVLRRLLDGCLPAHSEGPWEVAELGAGDGQFTARLWQQLPRPPTGSRLWLVDRQTPPEPTAVASLAARGWEVRPVAADALAWLSACATGSAQRRSRLDVVSMNLFAHHFALPELRELLARCADRTQAFAAAEPRRSSSALLGAWLLRFLGCNSVTRHDALVSVRAGFRGRELSSAWPAESGWELHEGPAVPFSHRFRARRIGVSR